MQPLNKEPAIQKTHLPSIFGKCLGLGPVDSQLIQIRSDKKKANREFNEIDLIHYINDYLPLKANLVTDKKGFTYLDLENEYIYELLPFIEKTGVTTPPYFEGNFSGGAHVSVILPSENIPKLAQNDYEREITFSISGCYHVEPENWMEIETLWFLTLDAPELTELRERYNLRPKLLDQEFHITFGVKKRFLSIYDIFFTKKEEIIIKDLF